MRTYCIRKGILLNSLWRPKWEGNLKKDICIYIADSFCCTVETNNIVKHLYSNKKLKIKK